jgi:hypothetical protein
MDPFLIGGLLLAAAAFDNNNNKKSSKKSKSHNSYRRCSDYDDGPAWQHDHGNLGI